MFVEFKEEGSANITIQQRRL